MTNITLKLQLINLLGAYHYMFPKQTEMTEESTRKRLILQNQKLHQEITKLQSKMSQVITKDITNKIAKSNTNNDPPKHDQLVIQQNYIKKLKNKIVQLKSIGSLQGQGGIVNKQQNQLITLKKQYRNLIAQRQVLRQRVSDKKNALEDNNPMKSYRNETIEQLAKIRKDNADKQAMIIELQREIRKYHKSKELYRAFKDEKITVENPQYEIAKLEHRKAEYLKKIKAVENKWKPQTDRLDRQYFATKQIYNRKQQSLAELSKQLSNWQNRVSAVRNEADVLRDRQRISKIPQSPTKQPLVFEIEQARQHKVIKNVSKKKKQKVTSLIKQTKNEKKKEIGIDLNLKEEEKQPKKVSKYRQVGIDTQLQKEKQRKEARKWESMDINTQKYESKSERINMNPNQYNQTRRSDKNEFLNSKKAFSGFDAISVPDAEIEQGKKNKLLLMKNVGVGTSFYYNEDEDN